MGMSGDTALVLAKNYVKKTLQGQGALKGQDGFSPIIEENADNTDKIYKLDITTSNSTFTTPNLRGKDGEGSGGGEANVIESISVNGTPISVDENKNVDISVPDAYDDTTLSNRVKIIEDDYAKSSDIPSLSGYATETWVNEQGFLTQHQDLSNYATKDEIPTVPSKVSELTNDSNYQTADQVNSTVVTEISKVVADAPEDLNTLKEMSDWIAGHEDDASAMNSAISDNKTAITALQTGKADKSEIPTELPANGGNSATVNGHTVNSDVPENAVFTDTTYSDATQIEHGLMSVDDKKKLDGLKKYTPDGTTITADEDGTLHGVAKVTVDDALSSTSTNPVQNKVVKAYVDKKASENVDFSTSTSKLLNDSIESPMLVTNATRNLLNPTLATSTQSGITCTKNGDGTYTLNGTCSVDSPKTNIIVTSESMKIDEDVKFICCTQSGSIDTFRASVDYDDGTYSVDYGEGTLLSKGKTITKVSMIVNNGVTVNNLVFKPMLTTDLEATIDDFVPYSGYDIKTCGKNLLDLKNKGKDTYTNAGITYTKQSDGSYKRTGTAASTHGNIWLFGGYKIVPNGTNHLLTLKKGHTYFINDCVLFSMVNGMEWSANNQSATPGVHTITPLQDTYITGIRDYGISKDNTYNDIVYPRIFEADHDLGWSPYAESTIHIDSTTKFPLLGLKSFNGITNIISPGNVKCVYPTNESGKGVLDSLYNKDKMLTEQKENLEVLGKCKNLLNPTLKTTTQNGVTCTNNGDGTYTLNGKATSEVPFYLISDDNLQIPKGIYKPICSTDDNIRSAYKFSNKGWTSDNQFEITQSDILSDMWIKVPQDYICDNVIVKPMITTNLNATYDDFVPYTGDGETLAHDVAELKNDLGGLSFSVSDGTLSITDGTNTWTLPQTT